MKIVMLSPYYNIIKRGNENFAYKMKKSFKERGHHIDILPTTTCNLMYKEWDDIIERSQMASFFKKFIGIEPSIIQYDYYKNFLKQFRYEDYDITWNNAEFFGALLSEKIKKYFGTATMTTFQGNDSMLMITEAMLKPNLFVVLTPYFEQFISKQVKGNIKCIPSGVDLDVFKPSNACLADCEHLEHPIFLSTSALTTSKRVDLIIDAVTEFRRMQKKGSLIVTSSGPNAEKIRKKGESQLGCHFKFLGRVKKETLPVVYNTSDVYIQASRSEGMSAALLESMACNKPCVVSRDDNRKWTINADHPESGGYCVPDNTVKGFVWSMLSASNINWGERPINQACKFSWDKTVDTYIEEMKKIC